MVRLVGSMSILCLAACASQPSRTPVAASSTPPAQAVVQPSGPTLRGPATPTQTSAVGAQPIDATAKQHAEVVRRALKSGYQVSKLADGSKRYCMETTPVGTRFAQKSCYTADQLIEVFARQDLYQDQMHQIGACGNAGCGGSN